MRLVELKENQQITLKGCRSQKETKAFLASDFYLEEVNFGWFGDEFNEYKS